MKNAVVLVSGGMDSAVVLAIARERGFAIHALSVRYGQRHTSELEAAARVARAMGAVAHKTVGVDLGSIGGSALTDAGIDVPMDQAPGDGEIPVTYVPARNMIFLSLALALAEAEKDILLGGGAEALRHGRGAFRWDGMVPPLCRGSRSRTSAGTSRTSTTIPTSSTRVWVTTTNGVSASRSGSARARGSGIDQSAFLTGHQKAATISRTKATTASAAWTSIRPTGMGRWRHCHNRFIAAPPPAASTNSTSAQPAGEGTSVNSAA